ncbi:SigE family RNA polymerase sigma factor [Lacisediminihabitans changchengi]|uniref:SigE family RNA polymerase sigma factor n=1 Tax=Lacisediminihabitans changchengi TaxID=2787634 RepID=A0A934SR17_9MICO|nr:SigE family RNA polymerase sigma factor [Lacisediminihabitans changchengi]MBK4347468.1 SigE family RNA polymerase sigma factor [Lacisediminihabitans changchengi]
MTTAQTDDGWRAVLTTLVAERGDALTRYARLISGNNDDAADLVQDALVKTFGRLRNGFSVASAEAYVRRAILNSYLDGGRRTSRWRRIEHFAATPELQESSAPATDARVDLDGHLALLSPRERACIVLRYYDDLTIADVADQLGISPGTVKRYVSDALGKLGAALDTPDITFDREGRNAQ